MRILSCSDEPSTRVLEACAAFGLLVRHDVDQEERERHLEQVGRVAAEIDVRLAAGQIALLTGESGCGKSTLLRLIADRCEPVVEVGLAPHDALAPMLELFTGRVATALKLLTRAGLADPTLLVRRVYELSDGQRARLAIALAMQEASRGRQATIVIDELGANLDATTARCTCAMLARWIRGGGHRLVAATPREDVAAVMCPEVSWCGDG